MFRTGEQVLEKRIELVADRAGKRMKDNDRENKGTKICPGCNEKIEKADSYCIHCGASQDRFLRSFEKSTSKEKEEENFKIGDRCLFSLDGKTYIGTVKKIFADDHLSRVVVTDSGQAFKVSFHSLKEIDLEIGDKCFFMYKGTTRKGKIVNRTEYGFTIESNGQTFDMPTDRVIKPKFKRGDTCYFYLDGYRVSGTVIKVGAEESFVKTDNGAFKVVNSLLSKDQESSE